MKIDGRHQAGRADGRSGGAVAGWGDLGRLGRGWGFALLLSAPGCVVGVEDGNGQIEVESREVGDFDAISAEISLPVRVTPSEAPGVEVTCDSNLLERITTEVQGDELRIRVERIGELVTLSPSGGCGVEVFATEIDGLTNAGSGDLVADGTVRGDGLALANTGSGRLSVDGAEVGMLELTNSGSGGIEVGGGSADQLTLTDTGSGEILARGVEAIDVDATLTGSGSVQVTATGSLDAFLSGSGDLTVWGDPEGRDVTSTGSGRVRFE